jgi:hypothetical protein
VTGGIRPGPGKSYPLSVPSRQGFTLSVTREPVGRVLGVGVSAGEFHYADALTVLLTAESLLLAAFGIAISMVDAPNLTPIGILEESGGSRDPHHPSSAVAKGISRTLGIGSRRRLEGSGSSEDRPCSVSQ